MMFPSHVAEEPKSDVKFDLGTFPVEVLIRID
jgi:hypothetical protein